MKRRKMMSTQRDDHPAEWRGDRARTVELTGKKWKLMILAGDILLYGGVAVVVVLFIFGVQWEEQRGWNVIAFFFGASAAFLLGALLTVVGRIGRWWYHS